MCKEILILSPFHLPNPGGAETFLHNLESEAKKWFNITVLTFQPFKTRSNKYEESYYSKGSLKIYRMGWWVKPPNVWSGVSLKNALLVFPKMALCSLLLMTKKKYKIVHGQGLLSGLVAVFLKKIFKCKAYITLLALYDFREWKGIKKSVAKWLFKNIDIIFVEGENGEKDIRCFRHNNSTNKIIRFNHWVDQSIYRPPNKRDNSKIRVLFIGRPIKEKGRHIVEAAERLLNDKNKYEFIYVEDIKFEDLPKYYQMAHICVVPSLYSEGYSRVVAESTSCGCAVITSNKGSLPEMVKDFGLTFDGTPLDLCKAIERFTKYSVYKGNGKLAYEYAIKNFSVKNREVFLEAYTDR